VVLLPQSMAHELAPYGISVNAVCPGTVNTDLLNPDGKYEKMLGCPEKAEAWIKQQIPLGRMQTADEVAAVIAWLLSDDARALTGEAVNASASASETMI
jgi:NAD(P)-dependent dehydrogenase (short-subunit alcohol dehydrogenase family)